MSSLDLLALFAVFGGICGFYLSVVGFAVTSVAIVLVVGVANAVVGGPFTPLLLLGAFVAQQTGFALAMIGRSLARHVARLRAQPRQSEVEGDLRPERDRPN